MKRGRLTLASLVVGGLAAEENLSETMCQGDYFWIEGEQDDCPIKFNCDEGVVRCLAHDACAKLPAWVTFREQHRCLREGNSFDTYTFLYHGDDFGGDHMDCSSDQATFGPLPFQITVGACQWDDYVWDFWPVTFEEPRNVNEWLYTACNEDGSITLVKY